MGGIADFLTRLGGKLSVRSSRTGPKGSRDLLAELAGRLVDYPDLRTQVAALEARCSRPLHLAVVGEFSSGKSTFVNALLGQRLLPDGPLPTTGVATYIQTGVRPSVVVELTNGARLNLGVADLAALCKTGAGEIPTLWMEQVRRIDVYCDSDVLNDLVLIDTPGLNAPNSEDHAVTLAILEAADAILWVSACDQMLSRTQQDMLRSVTARYAEKSVCIISKVDMLRHPEREVPALIKHAEQQLGKYFLEIIPVSAQAALAGDGAALKPFRTMLNARVAPLRRRWVEEAALAEARALVMARVESVAQVGQAVARMHEGLKALRTAATGARAQLVRTLGASEKQFCTKLEEVERAAAKRLREGLQTFDVDVPYTHTDEGWVWDDTEVRYRAIHCWEFDENALSEAVRSLNEGWAAAATACEERFSEALSGATKAVDLSWSKWHAQNSEAAESLGIPDSSSWSADDTREAVDWLMAGESGYWHGGMNHGGLFAMDARLQLSKDEKKRPPEAVRKMLGEFVPLRVILDNFNKSVTSVLAAMHQRSLDADLMRLEECFTAELAELKAKIDLLKSFVAILG
jgi:predicted GTPase